MRPSLVLSSFLFLSLLVGCHSRGSSPAPSAEGQVIGNGGDSLRVTFDEARDLASAIVRRVPPDRLEAFDLSTSQVRWLETNREKVARNVKHVTHVWEGELPNYCPPDTCACTVPGTGETHFSYLHCSVTSSQLEEAARVLLVEEHHRLTPLVVGREREEQAEADRMASSLLRAWKRLGHHPGPHTIAFSLGDLAGGKETYPSTVVWDGKRLLDLRPGLVQTFDPETDRFSTIKLLNDYHEMAAPLFTGGEIRNDREVSTLHGNFVAGMPVLLAECREHELSSSTAGFRLDLAERRWLGVTAQGAPESRRGSAVLRWKDKLVMWGGSGCAHWYSPVPEPSLLDGGVYDPRADQWTRIPDGPVRAPRSGVREGEAAAIAGHWLWVWGGGARLSIVAPGKYGYAFDETANGARYDLLGRRWYSVSTENGPHSATLHQVAVGLGDEVFYYDADTSRAFLYSPERNLWRRLVTHRRSGAELPRWSSRGALYAFAHDRVVTFLEESEHGPRLFTYAVDSGQWQGPVAHEDSLYGLLGISFGDDTPRATPFFTPWVSAWWTGIEWFVLPSGKLPFRFYP